ncbi:MAG: MerR family transcriptional regulator [Deltaproteobacteria bacterium]|nr:MerR family transcriptional regulator [Deltaproteobacteria bacterium]MBK8237857.1 MerR family transcriptional regulator [Deltaproteobacteria bacterium]MBK8720636.1 MerR family transcriptional regulator [Deltaproteobacteria bacterium]MBP7290759.1 MerR family transcriptional regulator [Nannocystaceae bacterium]
MHVALTEAQVREIEAATPEGLSSQELVAAFASRDVKFTEATLRKYVQLGLVPRSRRVGRKGKHLGSRGIYPVRAVRRINAIKKLMAEHYTIEEIQARFLTFKDSIEILDEALAELVRLFEERIANHDPEARARLGSELAAVRTSATELLEGVHRLEKMILHAGDAARPRGGGAAGATELL